MLSFTRRPQCRVCYKKFSIRLGNIEWSQLIRQPLAPQYKTEIHEVPQMGWKWPLCTSHAGLHCTWISSNHKLCPLEIPGGEIKKEVWGRRGQVEASDFYTHKFFIESITGCDVFYAFTYSRNNNHIHFKLVQAKLDFHIFSEQNNKSQWSHRLVFLLNLVYTVYIWHQADSIQSKIISHKKLFVA